MHYFDIPTGMKLKILSSVYDKHPGRLLGRRRTRTYKSCEILIVDDRRKYLSVIMNRIGKSRETGLEIIVWILSKADEWG